MEPEKKKLLQMADRVHASLRLLKMGETATILCNREFNAEETQHYIYAYAFHKRKWFKVKHDAVSNVLYAERAPPPPWERPPQEKEFEEP